MPDMPAPAAPASPRATAAAIILAAGKSTRMRSAVPKPLHPVCGLPLTRHVVDACRGAGIDRCVLVIGHEADAVREGLGGDLEYALQRDQRGTGHAVMAAREDVSDLPTTVVVLAGDIPLITVRALERLVARHRESGAAATLLTATMDDPAGYGRVVRNPDGSVAAIVEHKDATPEQRAIKEWNPSIYCFESGPLFSALNEIRPDNVQGELYLTDAIAVLVGRGLRVEGVPVEDVDDVLGVNTRIELAQVARIMRSRILSGLMLSGVTVTDPSATYVDAGVRVGPDSVLEPGSSLLGRTVVGPGCVIGPHARIMDSRIGDGTRVIASQVVGCEIGRQVRIGPFANLRPGCRIADRVKVGDFVEVKNSALGEEVSAGHLAYLGDADIGAGTNIGAGTITCNYDGKTKHRTGIGENSFIGTHTTLVAPVSVGDGAYTAAGSVITEDVPADSLAIARSRQTIKPGWAKRRRQDQEAQGWEKGRGK